MTTVGRLYIVAVPIGNLGDITLRALEILRQANAIICEEIRPASTLLKRLQLPEKELLPLNEHNEKEQAPLILQRFFKGESFALISDCGTPVFSDPGSALIRQCVEFGVPVTPIPGASSLMATLSLLDFKPERFYFAGFLPREKEPRRMELQRCSTMRIPVILMDTPYRLCALLDECVSAFGKGRGATLACDLTLPSEAVLRGSLDDVRRAAGKRKAEFILILHER